MFQNDLIIEMPRQRKQVSRYGKQDETVRISDLETSDSEVEEDENNGTVTPGNINQKGIGMRRRRRGGRDKDFDDALFTLDNAKEGFSRSDCFSVEKSLLVFGCVNHIYFWSFECCLSRGLTQRSLGKQLQIIVVLLFTLE